MKKNIPCHVSQHLDVSKTDPERGLGNGIDRKNPSLFEYSNIWFIGVPDPRPGGGHCPNFQGDYAKKRAMKGE
jgi:hypothetical protein